jgi:hypothetical protein
MTKLSIEPPQIIDAEQSDRFYWQLATPSVYHLGWPPAELSAEWNWRWSGFWWARRSEWNQAKLEKLIGTVEQDSLAASANSYVMSGRRPVETAHVWVLSRVILWFPVGAVAIFLSFVALNFTVVRKPVFMLAIAIVVGLLGMLWPDMAALVGQTAVLALGLVVLVMVMQSAVDSRVRKRSVFTNRPSTYIDRSDQYSLVRGVRPAAPATTHAGSSVGAHEG